MARWWVSFCPTPCMERWPSTLSSTSAAAPLFRRRLGVPQNAGLEPPRPRGPCCHRSPPEDFPPRAIANVSQYDRKMADAQRLLTDRIAIDDLLTHYATLIDSGRFEELDQVFTFDAVLDYRSAGGIRGSFSEVRDWLASVLPLFSWTQHLVVNRAIELAPGTDEATCRSLFHNPNSMQIEGRLLALRGRWRLPRPTGADRLGLENPPPGGGNHLVGQSHARTRRRPTSTPRRLLRLNADRLLRPPHPALSCRDGAKFRPFRLGKGSSVRPP